MDYSDQLDEIRQQIAQLIAERRSIDDRLSKLRTERTRIESKLAENIGNGNPHGGSDRWLIRRVVLADLVEQYCEREGKGAVVEIARASGLTTRTIRRIRNGDASGKEFINFPTFEKVAIAIGRDDLIHDDSLEIVSLTEARKSARVNATRPTGRSRTQ